MQTEHATNTNMNTMNPYGQTTYVHNSFVQTPTYPPVQTVIVPPVGVQPTVITMPRATVVPTTTFIPGITETTHHINQAGMMGGVVGPAGLAGPLSHGGPNPGYAAAPGAYPAVKLRGKHGFKGTEYAQPGFVHAKGGKNTKYGHKGYKVNGLKSTHQQESHPTRSEIKHKYRK
ncbi:hypothetical protein PROFUN_13670 [Planoprotostelium fungivorum]|uniref:Uncharacterized protein n=1 Tax=Planoprotostelium fungivorum TaxID=1890364 RepID=A0A2P6MN04_9EUKA|nr:hypothetical protein PROFUN_13670 [Planoprotostelium fungivorum]